MKWYYWLLIALAVVGVVLYFWKPWETKKNNTNVAGETPGASTTVEPGGDFLDEEA